MRYIIITLLISCSSLLHAQIKEGARVIDLSFGLSNTDNVGSSTFFFVQPLIGFGTSSNQLFYGGIRYESQKFDFGSEQQQRTVSLTFGYEKFFELNQKIYFAPFLSGSYGFGKSESTGAENDLNIMSLSFRPRLHYFINNKWSVVASVGAIEYLREVEKNDISDFTQEFFTANLNASNVFFGIRLNLNNE